MSSKPLIFVYPLSETMKKLKEAIEEISESEGVEVYEVDQLEEIAQLVPTIGQSLTIYGAPKKCAMSLKQLRKINSKLNSKVLLINDKGIPRKTLDKFSKIGLTEFIQEPVAAKTLLYKVKLQLKSIINENVDDDDDVGVKSSSNSGEEDEGTMYSSTKKKKEDDNDGLDYLTKKKKKSNFEIEEAEEKKKKNNYQEEEIASNWQGKVKKKDELEEDTEGSIKREKEEDQLDGYLRGKKELSSQIEEEQEKEKSKYKDEIADDLLKGKLKQEEIEEEEEEKRKKNESFIDIEEKTKNLQNEKKDTTAYYKGNIRKEHSEDEEEEKKRKLEIIDSEDEKDYTEKAEDAYEEEVIKKKTKLSIIEAEEELIQRKNNDEEDETEKKKKKELLIDELKKDPNEGQTDHIESKENSGKGSTDNIEKYMKGKSEIEDHEDEDGLKKKDKALELSEEAPEEEDIQNDNENDDNEKDYKKEAQLHIEDSDKDGQEENIKDLETDKDFLERKKDVNLVIDDQDQEREKKEEDEESSGKIKSKQELDIEEIQKERKKKEQEDHEEKERKKKDGKVDDLTKEKLRANSKVDKIETHYSSEASVSHVDDDWNFGKSEKKVEEDDSRKEREELLSYGEKVDLGEQTIDYRKLRDEFGGISIDREGNNVKKTGPKYYGGDSAKKRKVPTYYRDDANGEDAQDVTEEVTEDEAEQDRIYEPNSKGLENIVKVLNYYNTSESAEINAYNFVSKVIQNNFSGEVALFYYDEKKGRVEEATNSLNILNEIEREEKQILWDKVLSKGYRSWKDVKLPTWSDETFQESNIQFIYPYFEGTSLMGFAVTWFTSEFDEKRCKELEVNLESLRGFLISNFRKGMHSGEYHGTEKDKDKDKKKGSIKSLFGKLFGRKAS